MTDLIAEVREEINQAIAKDQLTLPTLPEVALKIREAAQDPDADAVRLTRVIENDAAISARLIKVANSPLMRASRPITDLKMAIARLGVTYTCNLATGMAMEQMFQATNHLVDELMRETWTKSTEVAGIAHVLCKAYTRLKPDQATLGGLVHKIGVLPILTYAENKPALLRSRETLRAVVDELHPEIGDKILAAWSFQPELANIPTEHMNFARRPAQVDYADVVLVANLQSYLGSDNPLAQMDWSQISAFERVGLSTEVNAMEIEDLSEDMEAAMAMLK